MPYSGQGFQIAGPTNEAKTRYAQIQNQALPFLQRLLSGEQIEGMTPRTAQRLMNIASPEVMATMHDRGYNVNPNWYQNYIQPGTVNPEAYTNIMQYALGVGNTDMAPDLKQQALGVWNNPTYQVGGLMPNFRQQQLQNWDTQVRMGMQGKTYDPYTGGWVDDPKLVWGQLQELAGGLQSDYAISQMIQAVLDTLEEAGITVNEKPNESSGGDVSLFGGAQPTLSYNAGNGLNAQAGSATVPTASGNTQPELVDTIWSQAELVNQANKLGTSYQDYIALHNDTINALSAGVDPSELDRLIREKTQGRVTLADITEAKPNWWVRNFPIISSYEPPRK